MPAVKTRRYTQLRRRLTQRSNAAQLAEGAKQRKLGVPGRADRRDYFLQSAKTASGLSRSSSFGRAVRTGMAHQIRALRAITTRK